MNEVSTSAKLIMNKTHTPISFAFCLCVLGICENTVSDFQKTILSKIIIFVSHLQQSYNTSSKDHQPTATEEY
jgi:hypothetical protein